MILAKFFYTIYFRHPDLMIKDKYFRFKLHGHMLEKGVILKELGNSMRAMGRYCLI